MKLLKSFLVTALLGTATITLSSCGKPAQQQQQAPQVAAVSVNAATIPITYEYAARMTAYKETEVRARVSGILLHRNFIEGSQVNQGDILFEIDPDTYEAEVMSARATVAQAEANYAQSVRDANRAEELVIQKVQSTAQRDQTFATRDANAATLQQARAQLRIAELNLQYTKVEAPISGLTSREAVPEGSLISSTGLLTTITQLDPIYVSFSYADKDANEIRTLREDMQKRHEKLDPMTVDVIFGDGSTYDQKGTVDFTSPTIDASTGTLAIRAVLDNAQKILVPGQFVRVLVHGVDMADAIVIPEGALLQNNSMQYVYLVKEVPVEDTTNKTGDAKADSSKDGANASSKQTKTMTEIRPVKVSRQLPDRSWLLEPATEEEKDVKLTEAELEKQLADAKAAGNTKTASLPTTKKITQVIGLKSGEMIVSDGMVRLQSLIYGSEMPVTMIQLDGKQTPAGEKIQQQQQKAAEAAQAGKAK